MGKLNFFLFFYYIFFFLLNEIKILYENFLRIFNVNFRYYNIFKLILFQFNKSIKPSNNNFFINFLNQNEKLWKNKIFNKNHNKKNKKKILITSFVHSHPAYPYANSIIGKYLEEYHDYELLGFCDNYDLASELIMRSFGIKKFYYLYEKNFFIKFSYFLKALIKIKKIKNMNNFLKMKYNDIDVGKIVYDDVLRRSGQPTLDTLSFKLAYHFSLALNKSDQYKKILNNENLDSIVQSETQFIPSAIIFQHTLAKKIKIYSREGPGKKMSIKKFSSSSQRYTSRDELPDNVFQIIYKNSRELSSKKGYQLVKNRLSGDIIEDDVRDSRWAHQNKKNYSKKELCKIFNWDYKKPIVTIFSHSLIDGNYSYGSRIFKDNLTWLRKTLLSVKDINKFNWMIKPHPMDWYYKFSKTTTEIEYKKIAGKFNHVKMCPKNISSISLSNLSDTIVTSHGSVSLEYVCLGIPAITAGRTSFSHLNINYRAKNKDEYFYYLKNINKLSKPNKNQIVKARIYSYIYSEVIKNNNELIPSFVNTRNVNQNIFFKDCIKLIKRYSHQNDSFKKMVFHQFDTKNSQTVNLNIMKKNLKIKKKYFENKVI